MTLSSSSVTTGSFPPVSGLVGETGNQHEPQATSEVRQAGRDLETALTPRAKGDSELADLYRKVLLKCANSQPILDPCLQVIEDIPAASTYGQWQAHLHNALSQRDFRQWAYRHHIDLSKPIAIFPQSSTTPGLMQGYVNGARKSFGTIADGSPLPTAWNAVMDAALVLSAGRNYVTALTPGTAQLHEVAAFYGESNVHTFTKSDLEHRATEIELRKSFAPIPTNHPKKLDIVRSEPELEQQQRTLGNICNNDKIYDRLHPPGNEFDSEQAVQRFLESHFVDVHPDSTVFKALGLQQGATLSMGQLIIEMGWTLPKNLEDILNLTQRLRAAPLESPTNGDFGGALSWPEPMSHEQQRALYFYLSRNFEDRSEGDVFGVLKTRASNEAQVQNPRRIITELLETRRATALGEDLQEHFKGFSTRTSTKDWLLAAIHTTLDLEKTLETPGKSTLTHVAGFDLAGQQNWGKHPSGVVKELANHLQATKRTKAEMAPIAAHLLLSHRAPAYLVQGIPASVTYGSHAWVSFSTAVARIEAESPGATAMMNYGQIMYRSSLSPVTLEDARNERNAQHQAIKEWALVNAFLPPAPSQGYTEIQMNNALEAFNGHIKEMKAASAALAATVPTRHNLALDELKKVLPETIDLKKKCITLSTPHRDFPGPYSVLDLYIQGRLFNSPGLQTPGQNNYSLTGSQTNARPRGSNDWVSNDPEIQMSEILDKAKACPDIQKKFQKDFASYVENYEKGLASAAKFLISKLPLEDRKTLESGQISIFKELTIKWTGHYQTREKTKKNTPFLLKIENESANHIYELHVKKGQLRKREDLQDVKPGPVLHFRERGPIYAEIEELLSPGFWTATEDRKKDIPSSLSSFRANTIANTLIKEAAVKDTLMDMAKGVTTFESEVAFYVKLREFLLNLIPLRSAIVNFEKGNIGAGVTDLVMDVFCLLISAASASAKTAKAFTALTSNATRLAAVSKFVGRTAIGTLNPLDGLGDAISRITHRAGAGAVRRLDVLALAKRGDIAEGVFKSTNGAKITTLAKLDDATRNWYHFDPRGNRAYGAPIEFTPTRAGFNGKIANAELIENVKKLNVKMGKPMGICYETALNVALAEKTISTKAHDTLTAALKGNYTQRYQDFMGITPSKLQKTFNPADIADSGFLNFRYANADQRFFHTAYLQKTPNNELFLFNANSMDLDLKMSGAGVSPTTAGSATVHSLQQGAHMKFQSWLDQGFEFAFTPIGELNANILQLAP